MTDPTPTLQAAREQTIDRLCREFANDSLSMGELERRLARARDARTRDDLRKLLADLTRAPAPTPAVRPGGGRAAGGAAGRGAGAVGAGSPGAGAVGPVGGSGQEVASGELRRGSHLAFAIMGGTRRAGRWAPPGNMLAVAVMGGVELDFREAVLSPGVTEINVFAFWGGVEIVVPPDVHVDTHGLAIMGGFEQESDVESRPPSGAPVIRVNGAAIMAGVEVRVKERGE